MRTTILERVCNGLLIVSSKRFEKNKLIGDSYKVRKTIHLTLKKKFKNIYRKRGSEMKLMSRKYSR